MATDRSAEPGGPPPRRTILAPLPDDPASSAGADVSSAVPPPAPDPREPARHGGHGDAKRTRGRGIASREEKPDSTTKAYLWRRNVRFIDTLVMNMEDHGARAGDINRSVVIRAAISALEKAGLARELARCTNEEELADLIVTRLGRS